MAAARLLIDTNVLIDALRRHAPAERFLLGLEPGAAGISAVTAAEIWAGAREGEAAALESFLSAFRFYPVDEAVARAAGAYVVRYGERGVGLPDALIAATALRAGAALVTRNTRHFPMRDFPIRAPY